MTPRAFAALAYLRAQRRASSVCPRCGGIARGSHGCDCCGHGACVRLGPVPAWWTARLRLRVGLDVESGVGEIALPTPWVLTPAQLAGCGVDVWNEETGFPLGLGHDAVPPEQAPQAVMLSSVLADGGITVLLNDTLSTNTAYELRVFDGDGVVRAARFVTGINVDKVRVAPVVARGHQETP